MLIFEFMDWLIQISPGFIYIWAEALNQSYNDEPQIFSPLCNILAKGLKFH